MSYDECYYNDLDNFSNNSVPSDRCVNEGTSNKQSSNIPVFNKSNLFGTITQNDLKRLISAESSSNSRLTDNTINYYLKLLSFIISVNKNNEKEILTLDSSFLEEYLVFRKILNTFK